MTPQTDRLERILAEAVEIECDAARLEFMDQACAGDYELKRRVEEMVANHFSADGFLDSPVPNLLADRLESPVLSLLRDRLQSPETPGMEGAGTVIGSYTLLEQIGEGGFGVVFMAEQQRPVQRQVALKVVKPGMDTRQVVARFEAERQALALMDHPGIARVFDGGETRSGRPYFVMELVRGVPITDFCDHHQLNVRDRLKLFVNVCEAVQHAHQKGVIHRDLKPSNIMVTKDKPGAPGVVKVIDFGIAKATGQQLTEKTLFTNLAQMIGTPMYMSPEQAQIAGVPGDTDTRTDIYSLGVVLYELLTGTTPFSKERLRSATFDEIRRIIREEDPPKPSNRLTEQGNRQRSRDTACAGVARALAADAALAHVADRAVADTARLPAVPTLMTISANRRIDSRQLGRLVRGELDWIVMKALEKDRNRRYETVGHLAADVRRYLDGEAVLACPPTLGYRVRKFVTRYRAPLIAASLVLLVLVTGIIGTSAGLIRAERERVRAELAEVDAITQRNNAVVAAAAERFAKESAQFRLAQLHKANDILTSIFKDLDPTARESEAKPLRVLLGERLEKAANELEGEAVGDVITVAQLQYTLGVVLMRLGHPARAVTLLTKARDTFTLSRGSADRPTLRSMMALAICYEDLGRRADAVQLREETLALQKATLGADDPDTLSTMNNLSNSYSDLGRYDDALQLREETLARRQAKLGPEHAETLSSMSNLANSYATLGRHADAAKLHQQILALAEQKFGPHSPETFRSMSNVALSYDALGRNDDAIKLHEETLTLRNAKLGPDHPDTLRSIHYLARSYDALGRNEEAVKLHEQSLTLRKAKLGPDHPDTLASMYYLARTYDALGRIDDALTLREEMWTRRKESIGPDHPDTITSMADLANTYASLKRHSNAVPLREELFAIQKAKLGVDHADTLKTMNDLVTSYTNVERTAEASTLHDQMVAIRRVNVALKAQKQMSAADFERKTAVPAMQMALDATMAALGPDHPTTLFTMHNLARAFRGAGKPELALPLLQKAVETVEQREFEVEYAAHIVNQLSELLEKLNQYDHAERWRRKWLANVKRNPGVDSAAYRTALSTLGWNLLQQQKWNEAEGFLRECLPIGQASAADVWATSNKQSLLGTSLLRQEKYLEAEPHLLQGYEGMKSHEPASDRARSLVTEALQRIVELYDAWGKPDQAAEWRKKLVNENATPQN